VTVPVSRPSASAVRPEPVAVPTTAAPLTAEPATTVRQIVLKLHSRCNLSCRYCYVYESVDQTWRQRPVVMSPDLVARMAERIGEHVSRHGLGSIDLILHGGEPLLAGHRAVAGALATIRAAVPAGTAVRFSVQTNGVLLDDAYLDLFHRYAVRVGVSIDGDAAANDRNRRYANGRGSHDRVAAGLGLLTRPEHRDLYAGLLCTIDLRNDPIEVYRALRGFDPPALDLLLPHGNWSNPPPRPAGTGTYADWLIAVFDTWYAEPEETTRIRLFESIISRLLGGPSGTEAIGGDVPGIVTVETDGTYEQSDALKTAAEGLAGTGLDIGAHSLDDVLGYLAEAAPVRLAAACRACPVGRVCGGGLRAHRYDATTLFDNPSVYCADLLRLITHIGDRVRADLAPR
jgi:uncharacterized protein